MCDELELAKEKRGHFFGPPILSEGNFFNICVLSQCKVHLIHFLSIHTFTYQKTLLHTLLLFVFKIVERLQCILKGALSGLRQFPTTEKPLKILKNAFILC